ncbi:DUF6152 family protein [Pararhizobium sp. IMCC21322]|uniref:DUF6152 family protein n=1 Tax=Pararhizobium sp. IMCC21322 TaxID=3067903 RepID=UPI0027410D5D|nr:DUF6152 family protein [Pararhizobium sp. IMCC21322]
MKKHKTLGILTLICSAAVLVGPSSAHHGVNGQFDLSQTLEVTGTVTNIRLVNPHSYVYFDVQNDEGGVDEWRCELRSGSILRRLGWSRDLFPDGAEITISGAPAREEPHACYTETITFADGRVLQRNSTIDAEGAVIKEERQIVRSDGTPNIDGNWVAPARSRPGPPPGNGEGEGEAAAPTGTRPSGSPADPPPGGGGRVEIELTEAGSALAAGYVREDHPRFNCQSVNIFDDWTFDQMVNRIVQTDDTIYINYGFMDIVREIHLDLEDHPTGIKPSISGHSIGRWEDGVLVVDTIGFEPGYLVAPPVTGQGAMMNSDEFHVVERFSLSEDGLTMARTFEGKDSVNLVGQYEGQDSVSLTDAAYEDYACEDLTNETLP